MAFSLVAHSQAATADTNNVTTGAVDTTGASLIALILTSNDPASCTISDSKSNTWTPLTTRGLVRLYYCINPTVGSGHTFSASSTGQLPALAMQAFSATGTVSFDQQSGATGSATSLQPGSITSGGGAAVFVSGVAYVDTGVATIDSSFSTSDTPIGLAGGLHYGIGAAYFAVGSSTAKNPTWTQGSSTTIDVAMATFKSTTTIAPGAGAITITGNAPGVNLGVGVPAGSIAFTGNAPTLYISPTRMAAGALTYTGYAPGLQLNVGVPAGALIYTGYVPGVVNSKTAAPGAGLISFTGYAPTISFSYLDPAHVWLQSNGTTIINPIDGTITEFADETPNTITVKTMGGTRPNEGDTIIAYFGSAYNNTTRKFAGTITSVQSNDGETNDPNLIQYVSTCIDWTWGLQTAPKLNRTFTMVAGDVIAAAIVATVPGYTSVHVQAGLAIVPSIVFKNASPMECLKQLRDYLNTIYFSDVNLKVDYNKDIHLTVGADASLPTPITIDINHPTLDNFAWSRDINPIVTRAVTSGAGSTAAGGMIQGDNVLPLLDVTPFAAAGGYVEISGGTQRLSYTGKTVAASGSLVGPGYNPTATPSLSLATGAGVDTGAHQYAVVFRTDADAHLSLPSPLVTINTGPMANPPVGPTGILQSGTGYYGGIDPGAHNWAVTFGDGTGETLPSPPLAMSTWAVTTAADAPLVAASADGSWTTQGWVAGTQLYVALTSRSTVAPGETVISINSTSYTAQARRGGVATVDITMPSTIINDPSGGTLYYNAYVNVSGDPNDWNTLLSEVVNLTLPIGPTGTALRNLYRTAAGSGQLKFVETINNNVTTAVTDSFPDSSLGANAPVSNTTALNHVLLSNSPLGPTTSPAVTDRWIYRTVAGGTQLKLAFKVGNNSSTSATDSTADASLGANAPVSDTSGIAQPAGQVLPGVASLPVTGVSNFNATGGYAIVGNGQQCIRYTGVSATALTGIPPTGIGAITAPVNYNSTVTPAPALTGIPSAGTMYANLTVNSNWADLLLAFAPAAASSITFDAVTDNGSSTSSFNHTVGAGTNRLLFVGCEAVSVSSVTYNGVAMTLAGQQQLINLGGSYIFVYALAAPASGTHSVVITGTGISESWAISYAGCRQTAIPDASAGSYTAAQGLQASQLYSDTVTPASAGCWLLFVTVNGAGSVIDATAGLNSTKRRSQAGTGMDVFDSNGITIAASNAYAVVQQINKGDAVNLLSIVDDTVAQTALAARLNADGHTPPSSGIFEDYVSAGNGVSQSDCDTRGAARLAVSSMPILNTSWTSHDPLTQANATVSINKDGVVQSVIIQQVTIAQWNRAGLRTTRVTPRPQEYPLYTVSQAGSQRVSLDRFVRTLR
jgi:hypothetical protein